MHEVILNFKYEIILIIFVLGVPLGMFLEKKLNTIGIFGLVLIVLSFCVGIAYFFVILFFVKINGTMFIISNALIAIIIFVLNPCVILQFWKR